MQEAGNGPPWFLIVTGAACVVVGLACAIGGRMAGALWRGAGGPEPGRGESRIVAAAFLFSGASLLTTVWAVAYPFAHGARPYAATIAAVVLHPLGTLAFVAVLAWLAVVRRFVRRQREVSPRP